MPGRIRGGSELAADGDYRTGRVYHEFMCGATFEVGRRCQVLLGIANSEDDYAGAALIGSRENGVRRPAELHCEIGRMGQRQVARKHIVQFVEGFRNGKLALTPVPIAGFPPFGEHMQEEQTSAIFFGQRDGVRQSGGRMRGEIGGEENAFEAAGTRRTGFDVRADGHYRNRRPAKNFFRRRTKEQALGTSAPVGTHNDQVDIIFANRVLDYLPQIGGGRNFRFVSDADKLGSYTFHLGFRNLLVGLHRLRITVQWREQDVKGMDGGSVRAGDFDYETERGFRRTREIRKVQDLSQLHAPGKRCHRAHLAYLDRDSR